MSTKRTPVHCQANALIPLVHLNSPVAPPGHWSTHVIFTALKLSARYWSTSDKNVQSYSSLPGICSTPGAPVQSCSNQIHLYSTVAHFTATALLLVHLYSPIAHCQATVQHWSTSVTAVQSLSSLLGLCSTPGSPVKTCSNPCTCTAL